MEKLINYIYKELILHNLKETNMVLHKRFIKRVALLTASTVMCMNVSALEVKDYKGHWAQEAISEWVSSGIVKGYEDGTVRPSQPLTRAELAVLLNRVFKLGYKNESINYKDVQSGAWYEDAVELVMSAEMMNDYEDGFRPHQLATREEAAYAFARAYHLSDSNGKTFVDSHLISDWAREEVMALIAGGYLQGRTDGTLAPQDVLTRADFITMLDKLTAKLYQASGVYTDNVSGNVVVNAPDITLKDMTISGNLYITEGVGEGDVVLENVKVDGNIIIEGGGEHSIEIKDSTLGNIYVEKATGAVRIALDENSKAENIKVASKVQLEGNIEHLEIVTKEEIKLMEATIKDLQILSDGGKVIVDKGSVIDQLVANAAVEITGNGKINKAFINADHVVIKDVALDKDGIVVGTDVEVPPVMENTSKPTTGGGGSSSSGNNGGGSTDSGDSNKPEEPENPDTPIEVVGVYIIGDTQVTTGSSIRLIADVETTGKDESFEEVTWSIKPNSLQDVKITEDGLFTAGRTTGSAIVIATSTKDPSKYAEHKIEVIDTEDFVPVDYITINRREAELSVGEGLQLLVDVQPSNATNKEVMWTSNNESIVQVDARGYITAIGAGEAIVTATTLDGKHSVTSRIVVKQAEAKPVITDVKVKGESTVEVGESIALQAEVTVLPDEDRYKEVVWTLKEGAPEGTTISQDGLLTAGTTTGSAIVIARSKVDSNKYAEHYVTITKKIPVESIKLSHENITLLLEEEAILTAKVEPADATGQRVKWTSSNPNVVSVDENGKIVAQGVGEATITVSTLDGKVSATCDVQVNGRTLKGKVKVEEQPVKGAKVFLYSEKDNFSKPVASVTTNELGDYTFENLRKGNYLVKAFYEESTQDYAIPTSKVLVEDELHVMDMTCKKVTSLEVKVVEKSDGVTPVQYAFVLVEGKDGEGNKWSRREETNGAGKVKFILPEDLQEDITYTLIKPGYEEETYTYKLQSLAKNIEKQTFKKEIEPTYPDVIEQTEMAAGTNPLGVGDTTYEALKTAGWRVESDTKLSTNSRKLQFENLNGADGMDAKIIYTVGSVDEDKDYEILLQYMIRKQSEATNGDRTFENLKQTIYNGSGTFKDGTRTVTVSYNGELNPTITIIFSNYTK